LDLHDKNSVLWIKITSQLKDHLETLRQRLEATSDLDETNILRGRILEVRGFLKSAEQLPKVEAFIDTF